MGNPVVHFEIISKDAAKLREFYSQAFNWEARAARGAGVADYALIHNETGIDGGIGEIPEGYDGHVTFYIGVSDIERALEKIERLGGTRLMGPDRVPGGPTIALFRDPQAHVIGLVQTPEVS
jgi:uncharacterized protein